MLVVLLLFLLPAAPPASATCFRVHPVLSPTSCLFAISSIILAATLCTSFTAAIGVRAAHALSTAAMMAGMYFAGDICLLAIFHTFCTTAPCQLFARGVLLSRTAGSAAETVSAAATAGTTDTNDFSSSARSKGAGAIAGIAATAVTVATLSAAIS
uniref:Uncharacterized protein n=1 Tax=Sarcocystis aucheniae TaxID=65407 RepID=A0A5P9S3K7_9APIC|nr:hypothetical protein [Sarcocystis aucheniae]